MGEAYRRQEEARQEGIPYDKSGERPLGRFESGDRPGDANIRNALTSLCVALQYCEDRDISSLLIVAISAVVNARFKDKKR